MLTCLRLLYLGGATDDSPTPCSDLCHTFQFLPSITISISAIKSLLQIFLGIPLSRFPWGFHCRACLVMLCFGFLSVCPIHLHFLLLNSSSTGGWLVFCQSSSHAIWCWGCALGSPFRVLLASGAESERWQANKHKNNTLDASHNT